MNVAPITIQQQKEVIATTQYFIRRASEFYSGNFVNIPVLFNLTGRASGMYCVKAGSQYIRFNPYLFSKYYDNSLSDTIPHEVAHYVTDVLYGIRKIRPHGREWQAVMLFFGIKAKATGNYDLTGIPTRQHKKIDYQCRCNTYQFTTRRHNMVTRGTSNYLCRQCGAILVRSPLTE